MELAIMEKVRLGEIAELITKGTTPTSIGYKFEEKGISFVKIEAISTTGRFLKNKFSYISEECNNNLKRSQLCENDILFSIAGAIGRVAIVEKEILPANTNQALAIIRINDKYNKKFLKYLFCSSYIKKQYNKKKQGVAQINLSLKDIAEFEIPVIDLKSQNKVVNRLDKVQEVIDLKTKQIEELDGLIKSQFAKMFKNRNYEKKRIGDFGKLQGGYAFRSKDFIENGVKLVQISNVNKNNIDWNEINKLPREYIEKYKEYSLKTGDIVIAMTRPIIKSLNEVKIAYVSAEDVPCLLNQRVGRFLINENKISKSYLMYCCKMDDFRNYVEKMSGKSLQPNISSKQIEDYIIEVPPIELQNQFACIVQKINQQKKELQTSQEETKKLQESLMNQYFG